jgi:hypothetical protein
VKGEPWDSIQSIGMVWRNMPGNIWIIRRYRLPKYNKKTLEAEIKSWVKQRQGRVRHQHYGSPFSRDSATSYEIKPPGKIPLWMAEGSFNLRVIYKDSILYTYLHKGSFPEVFQDIHEAVIMPYVKQYGGTHLDEAPQLLDMDLRPWFERYFTGKSVHETFIKALEKGNIENSPLLPSQAQTGPTVANINLDSQIESIQSASEEVSVPPGVTIKVKRSRTIEHTVDIDWQMSGGINIDSGFKPIISASVRGEIGQRQGRTYQESETLEYEVALNGETSTRYRLIWTDMWRKGVAEFQIGYRTQVLPFRFREWTKLDVYPI